MTTKHDRRALEAEMQALILTALQDKERSGAHQRLIEANGLMSWVDYARRLGRVRKRGPYFCINNHGRRRIAQIMEQGVRDVAEARFGESLPIDVQRAISKGLKHAQI